jgi:hypothetical protein
MEITRRNLVGISLTKYIIDVVENCLVARIRKAFVTQWVGASPVEKTNHRKKCITPILLRGSLAAYTVLPTAAKP